MKIPVEVPDHPYDVHVGPGIRGRVGPLAADHTRALRALVVTQDPVAAHWLDDVQTSLEEAGLEVTVVTVPDGETAKTSETLVDLWSRCAAAGLQRRDVVVALGGGVVCDLAGFLAATYNRGIDVVQVPTTLLAQVDAAIGGKAGIDLPVGKNLVGAIHQPAAVVADTDLLETLPRRVLREGFGEVVKHALIAAPDLFDDLTTAGAAVLDDRDGRADLVRRNVEVKAAVVAADVDEQGVRAHLNLGHTYAHALESLTGYDTWWHGEAVAAGILVALALGEQMKLHGRAIRRRTTELFGALGLPTGVPVLDRDAVADLMARDKKADRVVRYVVLDAIGSPTVVCPTRAEIDAAIDVVEDAAVRPPGDDATGEVADEAPDESTDAATAAHDGRVRG
ncbi:3-dehydroquinate synthase [Salsipaludibacter albus]|uniref:3-dehydroquinate synthase n=1 Tax=Salsipaludibacter albus TaxID=2849650 RepID=UPI001EE466A6|nr:3-dehydroquinate synthase [Salsipaludibacter albus]